MYPNQQPPHPPSGQPPENPQGPPQTPQPQDTSYGQQQYQAGQPQPVQQYQQQAQPQQFGQQPQQYQPGQQFQQPQQYPQQPVQSFEQPIAQNSAGLPFDYLNQIAPQAQKRAPFSFGIKQVLMIGVALVVLMIILVAIVNGITGGKSANFEHLSVRLTNEQTIVTAAQPNLKSSQLRSLNSSLELLLTNTNRDITIPLTNAGINVAKIDKKIVAAESITDLTARLEDARLNAVYDRTYAREMAYELSNTLTLMNQIYTTTKSESLKTFLKTAYDNLKPTQESFANFTSDTN